MPTQWEGDRKRKKQTVRQTDKQKESNKETDRDRYIE